MRAAVPVVLGYLGIGIAAGVVERAAGLSYAEVLLISAVLYAGSARLVVTSMLSLASSASAIVLTVFFLNLRHLLLSAALAPALRGVPAWKNALLGLQLTDETFVVASGRRPLSPACRSNGGSPARNPRASARLRAGHRGAARAAARRAVAARAAALARRLAALRADRGARRAARDRAPFGGRRRPAGDHGGVRACGRDAQPPGQRDRGRCDLLAPKLSGGAFALEALRCPRC